MLSHIESSRDSMLAVADTDDSEWRAVDRRLRENARHRSALDAAEAFDLVRAEQLKIERLVANHRPGDRPDDPTDPDLRPRVVRLELPPEVYALWRQGRMVVADERGAE